MRDAIVIVCWLLFIVPLFVGKGIIWPAQQLFVLIDNVFGLSILLLTWCIQTVLLEFFSRHKNWIASAGLSVLMLLVCVIVTSRLTFFTDTFFYVVYHLLIPPDFFSESVASFLYYSWFYGITITLDTVLSFTIASYYRPSVKTKPFFMWLLLGNAVVLALVFAVIFMRS